MITTQLTSYQNLDDSDADLFGSMIWADLDPDDFFNIAQVRDPINHRMMWALDHNAIEIGRFWTVEEAKAFAAEYSEAFGLN